MDKIHFYSYQDGLDTISFETKVDVSNDKYSFKDESYEDTFIEFLFNENEIEFKRFGKINNLMTFRLNEYTKATYKNDMGLEFEYEVLTKEIFIKDDKIKITYDYFMDKEKISSVKIILILKTNLLKN